MISAINESAIDDLHTLIERYLKHKEEPETTVETIKQQMKSGISKHSTDILVKYDNTRVARGFLVYGRKSNRFSIIFADWNFATEKELFEYAFQQYSKSTHYITFESGYPTPWISEELSQFAVSLGFTKHDRGYMRLEPIDIQSSSDIDDKFSLVNFDSSQVETVSPLIFRCVDNTVDQKLFPFVYGTVDLIKQFKKDLLEGKYGTHKSNYSWILYNDDSPIGACFMTAQEKTGFVMHIVIDPAFRQNGLGKNLLNYSIKALQKNEPKISRIELAVTLSNPALKMYRSVGFRILNESSTYVWKK